MICTNLVLFKLLKIFWQIFGKSQSGFYSVFYLFLRELFLAKINEFSYSIISFFTFEFILKNII